MSETPPFRFPDLLSFSGYRQAGFGFVVYGTAVGAVYFVVAPLFAALLPDLGWSVGVLSTALLIRGLLGIVVSPLTGWLVARVGIRVVVGAGALTTAGFTALTGTVTSPVTFCLVFGLALSVADLFMGFIPITTLVHRWFMARRGAVMGFVNASVGLGGLVFAPLMAVLIDHFGWRHALFLLGVIILALSTPSVFIRERPRDLGQWVDGVEGRVVPERGGADAIGTVQAGLRRMVRSPLYWMIFTIFGIEVWALGVYAAYQVLYLKGVGVGTLASSSALGVSAGVAALSGLAFAWLSDRISPYFVLIASTVLMSAGSVAFLSARDNALLWVYSLLFGAGYGLLVPTVPVALSHYFGALDFSEAFGTGQILTGVMAGVGPWLTGVISDHTGSFTIPVYLVTGLLLASVLIAVLARPALVRAPASAPVAPALASD